MHGLRYSNAKLKNEPIMSVIAKVQQYQTKVQLCQTTNEAIMSVM